MGMRLASATLEVIYGLRPSARSIRRALSIVAALALMVAVLLRGVVIPARLAPRITFASAAVELSVLVVWAELATIVAVAAVVLVVAQVGLAPVVDVTVTVPIEVVALPLALARLALGHRMRVFLANIVAVIAVVGVALEVVTFAIAI